MVWVIKFTLDPGRAPQRVVDELYQCMYEYFVALGGEGMIIKNIGGNEYEMRLNGDYVSIRRMVEHTQNLNELNT